MVYVNNRDKDNVFLGTTVKRHAGSMEGYKLDQVTDHLIQSSYRSWLMHINGANKLILGSYGPV